MTEFKQLQVLYNDKILQLDELSQQVDNLTDLLINQEDQKEIDVRITNLETSVTASQSLFDNTEAVVKMIENVNDKVNDIIAGTTSIEVSYNLDSIKSGPGITIDRSIPNRVRIINTNQEYNIENTSISNLFINNNITLGRFSNYVRHENANVEISLDRDLQLFIDDSNVSWSKGQTMQLVFKDPIDLNIYNIKIYTDALNRLNLGSFGKLIVTFDDTDFLTDDNPIFQITCIDKDLLTFKIDKIR